MRSLSVAPGVRGVLSEAELRDLGDAREIRDLRDREAKALRVRNSGTDKKWDEHFKLLPENDEPGT